MTHLFAWFLGTGWHMIRRSCIFARIPGDQVTYPMFINPENGSRFTAETYSKHWANLCPLADLPYFAPRLTRHMLVEETTDGIAGGLTREQLAAAMNHSVETQQAHLNTGAAARNAQAVVSAMHAVRQVLMAQTRM